MITNKEVRISVNKTLTRKLIYVVAALTLLAMLIPAMAVPVGAAPGLSMVLVDPITGVAGTTADSGYNIRGSIVEVTSNETVTWSLLPPDPAVAQFFPAAPTAPSTSVRVQGWLGNVSIQGTNSANVTSGIGKKFGLIDHTDISSGTSGSSGYVTWNESTKAWEAGPVTITDTVFGAFSGVASATAMQGAILDWYLLPANVNVDLSQEEWYDHLVGTTTVKGLKSRMTDLMNLYQVQLVSFSNTSMVDTATNVTGADGKNSVKLYAKGEEAVQVICIAHYPTADAGSPQLYITPEKITYDFFTTESEVVPQVRWAGEKIVLEKHFGTTYNGKYVQFALENQSIGALEPILASDRVDHGTVWTTVSNGFASAILTSSDQGQANVIAGLYEALDGAQIGNQHYFTVYFLKFESVQISDVNGKRAQHNAGLWNPDNPNPWSTATDYGINNNPAQTLNVSQDALVRARVKGWFTNGNPGTRPVRTVDPTNSTLDNPGTATLTLPAGRWILPDDWAKLAGTNWKQSRIHWDIMNTVGGNSTPAGTEYAGAAAVYMSNPAYNATTNPNVPKMIENVAAAGELGDYYLYVGTDYKYKPVPPNPVHTKYPIVGNDDIRSLLTRTGTDDTRWLGNCQCPNLGLKQKHAYRST